MMMDLIGKSRDVPVRVQDAEACHIADVWFEHPPIGQHEGLVVKSRREKPRETIDEGIAVVFGVRLGVDAFDNGAVPCGFGCRPNIWAWLGYIRYIDEGVRLFATDAPDPAWTMILEAPPDDTDAVGEQRRSDGVPGVAVGYAALEGKRQPLGAID